MCLDIKAIINDPSILIQRKKDQLFSTIDDEVVMLDINNEKYYYLNSVGSKLWQILESPMSFDNLTLKMSENYNIQDSNYISDILEFLIELYKNNLLEISKVS